MITKKEDLINTYIKNDHGELRDLYTKKAVNLGLSINISCTVTSSRFIFTTMNPGRYGNVDHTSSPDHLVSRYGPMRELTLSDLKPSTKTEFVKLEFNHAWEAARDHEERVEFLYRQSDLGEALKGNNWKAIQSPSEAAQYHFDLYRRVETEIDERQEFIEKSEQVLSENTQTDHDIKEACGALYDAGCRFKLVDQ